MNETRDGARVRIKGEWWDEYYRPDPATGALILDHRTPVRHNDQMDASLVLISALLKGEAGYAGILYHCQGHGDNGWGAVPPAVDPTDSTLFDEFDRRSPDSVVFLDNLDVPTATPTTVLRISTTYALGDLAGETIREQALFGGNATLTLDSGQILNTIRHDAIVKSGALVLTRRIKLTLSV